MNEIAAFEWRPSREEMAILLGWRQVGSSDVSIRENESCSQVVPDKIPVLFAAIFMSIVSTIGIIVAVCVNEQFMLAIAAMGLLCITPAMCFMLHWINQQVGDKPYLVLEKSGVVAFPRLEQSWNRSQIKEIIRRNFSERHFEVVALIQENEQQWLMVLIVNAGGNDNINKRIGKLLGVRASAYRYTMAETKRCFDHRGLPMPGVQQNGGE